MWIVANLEKSQSYCRYFIPMFALWTIFLNIHVLPLLPCFTIYHNVEIWGIMDNLHSFSEDQRYLNFFICNFFIKEIILIQPLI
jgi:hypothetical protein